jgi:hypothetical protein|tara:strand:+ start:452 stop:787 length:336 start_codon:yes stop_codon:yes gene_type:complete
MKKFCSECGKKVEYKFSPPKFCSDCGAPMGVATINESRPLTREVSRSEVKEDRDGYTNAEHVPDISKLEYDVDLFDSRASFTLGQLGGHNTPRHTRRRKRSVQDFIDEKNV